MFTHKDIETRTIFVVNCIEHHRGVRVSNGELLLEEKDAEKSKVLTKFPFQKILAIFFIGHITVTTPLIEKCHKFNVALVVMKPNLRPVFFWSDTAEANYLLRQRQHTFKNDDLSIAKVLVKNKILNQQSALKKTRKKDDKTLYTIAQCEEAANAVDDINDYTSLLGLEGVIAKNFFNSYFQNLPWPGRRPRIKSDIMNVTLDIGYTLLFNYMESFLRMFGFDIYVGVYHRLWFKRKSLVCDLIEPFRCIIDHTILLAFNRKQFTEKDFEKKQSVWYLKHEKCADYYRIFFDALIEYKKDFFIYVQSYYRCFMGKKSAVVYPYFYYK